MHVVLICGWRRRFKTDRLRRTKTGAIRAPIGIPNMPWADIPWPNNRRGKVIASKP